MALADPARSPGPARLGDLLLRAGLLTESQLAAALAEQRVSGERIGEILTRRGVVSEEDLARAVADQMGLPLQVGELPVSQEALALVPEPLARRLGAFPVAYDGTALTVAVADPLRLIALDDLASVTGKRIRPVVTTAARVEEAIARAYRAARPDDDAAEAAPSAAAEAPSVVRLVDEVIERGARERASDIHVEPADGEVRLRFRIDGGLRLVRSLPPELHAPVVSRIKVMAGLDIAERRLPQDGRLGMQIDGRPFDLRVSTLPTVHGEKAVLRLLDKSRAITRLEDLGLLPDDVERLGRIMAAPHGMVLVTGPTGSGKTTTLTALLAGLNAPDRNLVTVEDPVEYELPGVNHVQVNARAGLGFSQTLRAILRQDPDVVMVGEIRDAETARIAVRAALTGHVVLSTLHTNSAAATPTRLTDMGVEPYLLAACLTGVVSQRLVRRLCNACAEETCAGDVEAARFALGIAAGERVRLPRGCARCGFTGYRGRLALAEVMPVDARLRELIAGSAPVAAVQAAAVSAGMRTLLQDGVAKARRGDTSPEEVRRAAWTAD